MRSRRCRSSRRRRVSGSDPTPARSLRAEWSGAGRAVVCSPSTSRTVGARLARSARLRRGAARGSAGPPVGGDAARPRRVEPATGKVLLARRGGAAAEHQHRRHRGGADGLALGRAQSRPDADRRRDGAMTHFGERDGAQGNGYAEGALGGGRVRPDLLCRPGRHGVRSARGRASVRTSRGSSSPRSRSSTASVAPRWLDPGSPLERTIDAQSDDARARTPPCSRSRWRRSTTAIRRATG